MLPTRFISGTVIGKTRSPIDIRMLTMLPNPTPLDLGQWKCNFKIIIIHPTPNRNLEHFLWKCYLVNNTRPHRRLFDITLGNGLMPSVCPDISHLKASLVYNRLNGNITNKAFHAFVLYENIRKRFSIDFFALFMLFYINYPRFAYHITSQMILLGNNILY